MKTIAEKKINLNDLSYLPSYAQYLLDHKLDELVKLQMRISEELQIPLLRLLSVFDENQRFEISKQGVIELLTYLAQNKANEQINHAIQRWESDELNIVGKGDIELEDITRITYLRKKSFLYFIPDYCRNTKQTLELVQEIDLYLMESETRLIDTYLSLLQQRVDESAHFIQKVAETSPGIIYVYDVINNREVYVNRAVTDFLGYRQEDLTSISKDFVLTYIHPDDLEVVRKHEVEFMNAKDGEVRSVKYRIRNSAGEYRWMRAFEAPFKRDQDGKLLLKIGIAIDVHEQKVTADKLQQSDALYKQAESLTHIGNYIWDLRNNELTWSEELYRIYELDPHQVKITYQLAESYIDLSEIEDVRRKTKEAITEKKPFDFYYQINLSGGHIKILHARGKIASYTDGKPNTIIGTVQDVTEKQTLILKLKHSDDVYRQAEALANMGNFTFDLVSGTIEWTDQLYRIYGLEPQSEKITYERFLACVHPRDKKLVQENFDILMEKGRIDYSFQIMTDSGQVKTLRTIAEVLKDKNGQKSMVVGIEQDISERQDLVQKLQKSESLYRQAESMTNMGNWTWDLISNKIEWTDQLYRIYGLEPQSEEITIEKFLSFIHPDDRPYVESGVDKAFREDHIDYTFRIVLKDGTSKTLRSIAQIQKDENGVPVYVVGTERDITEKQKLINELKHSDNLYKQAQQLAHIGNWSWNIATNKIEWSDELYRIFGLEPQSIVIDLARYTDLLHPDDKERVVTIIEQSMKDFRPFELTHRIRHRDGSVRVVQSYGETLVDKNSQPYEMLGTVQDITERHVLIEKLQESQQLYEQAQSLAHIGNWSWEFESGKVEWSAELYRIYNLQGDEPLSLEFVNSFVHPDDRERISTILNDSVKNGTIYDAYHRIVLHNGEIKTIHRRAEVLRNKEGKPCKMIGSTQDVTERQNLIERLQESEQLYKQAQLLSRMGNFTWDIKTGEVYWSEEVYHIYGVPPGRAVRFENAFLPIIEEDKQKVQAAIELTIQSKKGQTVSYAIQMPDGPIKYVNLQTDVILDNEKNVTRILGTAQDITERQQLIEKLQESEKLYKQAQSLAHLGNWSWDIHTEEYIWSDEMYRIYELDKNQKISFSQWQDFIHPEDRQTVIAYLEECIRSGRSYDKKHRIILPGGRWKVIHRKGEFIRNAKGEIVKMIGTTQDVTEQHRIQQELEDNQTFIRKITDATPSIIASYNINTGEYVFISEGLEKLLGYPTSEVFEKGVSFFADIIHPEDAVEMMQKNARSLEEANANPSRNDMVIEFTYRMRHRNGHYRWFHTYGTIFDRNREGKVEHVLNISLDVTDQVEASETIKEQEHFIQQIADASPTILYLYDVEKQSVIYINREIFFVLGYIPEEIIEAGAEVTDLLYHPDDFYLLPERHKSSKKFQQADSMIQYECRMKNKDGEWRWLLVREIAFKTDEHGRIVQILGAALDINRRKEMEKALLQNSYMLEQSNASLEEFAYVASHDLKEPLRKISTFGDRLLETEMDRMEPTGKLYLKKIVDASQRMQIMINDLLSISMISGNRKFETYSLQKILEETLQTLEFKIEQLNAVVTSDPLPEADIVPSQFRQLFQNLLSNSLKFIREGVRPEIRISYRLLNKEDVEHFGIKAREHYHKIEFSDNGIGFENEFAGKIFAIFQRLHGRSEYEGSGIGLAICKKIVEHHGGIIFANGRPNEGSVFTIILPV